MATDIYYKDIALLYLGNTTGSSPLDQGPDARTMTLQGSAALSSDGIYLPGTGGNYVSLSNPADFKLGDNGEKFTLEMQIRLNHLGYRQTQFGVQDGTTWAPGGLMFQLYVEPGNHLRLEWYDDSAGFQVMDSSVALTTATWYDIAVTFDGSILRMYIDQTLVATSSATALFPAGYDPSKAYLGDNSSSSSVSAGNISGVRITKNVVRDVESIEFPSDDTGTSAPTLPGTGTVDDGEVQIIIVTDDEGGYKTVTLKAGCGIKLTESGDTVTISRCCCCC